MKFRLKTYEQLETEFRPYASIWKKSSTTVRIKYNNFNWYINNEMFSMLGRTMELKEIPEGVAGLKNYTHENVFTSYPGIKWVYHWHKLWFEPEFEDFIKEEEFMI
jgi:hypothetical protein